jgi:hypothetical protein
MVEYGNGIGNGGAGQVGGGGGGGGAAQGDWGIAIGNAVNDAWHTFTALPAWQMAALVILIVGGLIVVRRAL